MTRAGRLQCQHCGSQCRAGFFTDDLLVGQIGDDCVDREAFQEVDYRRMFGSMAKWVTQIDRIDRIPEYMHRAFRRRRRAAWPVVLALPENLLFGRGVARDVGPARAVQASPAADDMARLKALLMPPPTDRW